MNEEDFSEDQWLSALDSHPGFSILKLIFGEELKAVEQDLDTSADKDQIFHLVQYWKLTKRFLQMMEAPAAAREELKRLREEEGWHNNPYRDPLAPPVQNIGLFAQRELFKQLIPTDSTQDDIKEN